MEPTINEVMNEVKQLRIDVNILMDNMNGKEELTEEEHARLDQAMEEYRKGDVISHEDLKKELGLS